MNRIVGLDVGRGSAVLCCLNSLPDNILQHYKKLRNERSFLKVNCTRAGVETLLSLFPTAIVLEPSGYWYSQFWVTVAQNNQIAVYWVGHADLAGQRQNFGFTNKRDEEDALCLAACYFNPSFVTAAGERRFLKYYQAGSIARIRELFHEKEQLQKLRSGMVAQLRQRLCYEFPEIAKHTMKRSSVSGYTPIIYWLSTGKPNIRYDNKYATSIAPCLGITITDYTRDHARAILQIELRLNDCVIQIEKLTAKAIFNDYNRVFDRFGFGINCRSLLLVHVYPIERFLVDGKPWIEYERSERNLKLQKRDRSLRKFQAYLGLSYRYEVSGDSIKRKYHGSSTVRSHLYMWAVCMVARQNNIIDTDIGKRLCDRYQELRSTVKGKDSLNRILFKATRILFYELVNQVRIKSD